MANIRNIADISHYSLVAFKTELSKCFGYPYIYDIYIRQKFQKSSFLGKFIEINYKE
ncbi:unnamed protein product [marine sediment metagenome]|uniref:Uncharacterized protein n=1 Tax=marine sediment metagenome TaxID=412755 RepID=X1ANV8_9ZZZZ